MECRRNLMYLLAVNVAYPHCMKYIHHPTYVYILCKHITQNNRSCKRKAFSKPKIANINKYIAHHHHQYYKRATKYNNMKILNKYPMLGTGEEWNEFYLEIFHKCWNITNVPTVIFPLILNLFIPFDINEIVLIEDENIKNFYFLAQILDIIYYDTIKMKNSNQYKIPAMKVHYLGWSSMFDRWIAINSPSISKIMDNEQLLKVLPSVDEQQRMRNKHSNGLQNAYIYTNNVENNLSYL